MHFFSADTVPKSSVSKVIKEEKNKTKLEFYLQWMFLTIQKQCLLSVGEYGFKV